MTSQGICCYVHYYSHCTSTVALCSVTKGRVGTSSSVVYVLQEYFKTWIIIIFNLLIVEESAWMAPRMEFSSLYVECGWAHIKESYYSP